MTSRDRVCAAATLLWRSAPSIGSILNVDLSLEHAATAINLCCSGTIDDCQTTSQRACN